MALHRLEPESLLDGDGDVLAQAVVDDQVEALGDCTGHGTSVNTTCGLWDEVEQHGLEQPAEEVLPLQSLEDVVVDAQCRSCHVEYVWSPAQVCLDRCREVRHAVYMASKKGNSPSKSKPKMTKREFINSLPATMGPSQVVAEGKKVGISLDPTYVSKVRPMKKGVKGLAKPRKAARPSTRQSPIKARLIVDHGEEALIRFLELAKALGKERARRLIELL